MKNVDTAKRNGPQSDETILLRLALMPSAEAASSLGCSLATSQQLVLPFNSPGVRLSKGSRSADDCAMIHELESFFVSAYVQTPVIKTMSKTYQDIAKLQSNSSNLCFAAAFCSP